MKRLTALGVALLLLASACAKQNGGTTAKPTGILRVANYVEPTSLNPLLATNTGENFLSSLAFNLLVTLNDKGNQVPDLAARVPSVENHGISTDGRTITYYLRHGVTWQDGAPFTSADVKFSWQAVMNPNNNVVERRGYDQVASVDTPDPYTVVFHLKQPFAPFVDTVFGESDDPFRIVPKHLLARYPNINRIPFNQKPIGTGPFQVVRWYRGDHVEYAANPHYFGGAPKLRTILVYTVPDGNTQMAELRSHGSDLLLDISATTYHGLTEVGGVKALLVKAPSYTSIVFNFKRPPLDDIRVRRAIVAAINDPRLVRDVTFGTATVAVADLSDFYWAFDSSLKPAAYDPSLAGRLLDQAGWRRDASGMRSKGGRKLSLQLVYGAGSATAQGIAVEVQSDLRRAGIDVPIKIYPYSMLYATQQLGGILQSGKFDLAEYAWVAGADPDNSSQWLCKMAPPKGNNIGSYCDPALDAAETAALNHFDRPTRKRAYSRIESLLIGDAPAAFNYYTKRRYGLNPNLQNFSPNGISEGWNANQWSL
ncbi:MAG TPA: peptide ABC transporter substrate-binding protein [Candidatus Rubrimentiphilum sp.]|nr:peptide ABC transporter substrate-binding protein [Candidatus Rubrimentiphilum sp.]